MTTTEKAIIAELKRQGERHHGPYIHTGADGEPTDAIDSFLVDGRLDIGALAAAVDAVSADRIEDLERQVSSWYDSSVYPYP